MSEKKLKRRAIGVSVLAIILILMGVFLSTLGQGPIQGFIENVVAILFIGFAICLVLKAVQYGESVRQIRSQSLPGKGDKAGTSTRKAITGYKILTISRCALYVLILVIGFTSLFSKWHKSTTEVKDNLPYIPLNEI